MLSAGRKNKKWIPLIILLCFICVGCQANLGSNRSDMIEEISTVESAEETYLETIPIKYPFPYAIKGYTLALVASREVSGQYDLQVCNEEGTIVQQFLCGAFTQPVTIRYDDLYHDTYADLEIFSAGSQSGVLFPFEAKYGVGKQDKIFQEAAIEIPFYEEARSENMMVRTEHVDCVEKSVYQLNADKRQIDIVRQWRAQKDKETLQIWDCLEQKMIFAGQTKLYKSGEPVNAKYFEYLLWNDIYLLGSWTDEMHQGQISKPDEKSGSGKVGLNAQYTNRQSLLEEFGFAGQEPKEQYYDSFGNIILELFVNERDGKALGIVHEYCFTSEQKKIESIYSFVVNSIEKSKWQELNPFDTKAYDGSDGANQVEDYEEAITYRADRKLDFFHSRGNITWLKDAKTDGKDSLVQIDYIYRDDGTLFYQKYYHNGYVFGSTFSTQNKFFDHMERICYEERYITHGNMIYYYFYDGDERKTIYLLTLDCGMGMYIPRLIQYQ